MKIFLLLSGCTFVLFSCNSKKDYEAIFRDPILYCKTVHQLNDVVMGNNFSPVVASRNYAYASIAGYEVIAAGYPNQYQSLAGQLHGLENIPRPNLQNVDYDFAALLAYCRVGEAVTFPEGSMKDYVDSLKNLALDHGMSKEVLMNSDSFAHAISNVILAWSKKDNYGQTRSASKFTVLDSPGRWVPTPPMYAQAAEPHWAEIRPFVLDSVSQFSVPPPPQFNLTDKSSKFYSEVMKSKIVVDSLTDEQKNIADFWDDNPFKLNVSGHVMFSTKKFSPPGHWMSVVGIAAQKSKADYATTVYAFTKTSIALFDAFIQCWKVKYNYNTARPETVINKFIDADWRPYLQTPPFPEYTCGHATVSSAAAVALTSVFGDNFSYTDSTEMEFGIPSRSYKSFRDAAMENVLARFYGGIHYHNSCVVGNMCGKEVGDLVVNRLKMKK